MIGFLVAAALSVAQPSTAVAEHADAIALAEERGARLYAYDRVAWVGTDHALPQLQDRLAELRGYVITEGEDGQVMTFFGEADGSMFAAWRATYRGEERLSGGRVERDDEAAALTPDEQATIAARTIAIEQFMAAKEGDGIFWCAKNPNVAVLPPEGDDEPFLVYLMTPQTTLQRWPLGGHSRIEVTRDGSTSGMRGFTKSCIELGNDRKENEDLSAMFITHILDPVPTEIHYFTMLASKVPMIVGTGPDKAWQISSSSDAGIATEPMDLKAKNKD